MDIVYVYWIRKYEHTEITSQGYVGITKNTKDRWQAHKECKKACHHLENAIQKHGWDSLVKEIIFTGTFEECQLKEQELRPLPMIGWNIRAGGQSIGALADVSKAKISAANKGNKYCLGRVMSKNTRDKIAKARSGLKLSTEHKLSISAGLCIEVVCINTGQVFKSVKEAAQWCGLKTPSAISAVCLGKRKSAGKHPDSGDKLIWEKK